MSDEGGRRCSDRDRDQAASQLREALSSGRIDRTEFGDRLDAVLTAKTLGELDWAVGDLPLDTSRAADVVGTKIAFSLFGRQSIVPVHAKTIVISCFGRSQVDLSVLSESARPRIVAVSLFGSTKVLLGREQYARLDGVAIFGRKHLSKYARTQGSSTPIEITCLSIMGSVVVSARRR
ncbi:DUF1707 domain-containing protein [Ferrimicrobium sp.]|uniref:DUF1707 SHOCT-like domain-containing protein n=1 Tax=Ferrimicrobium sp. TaxID=2926050 RepID=UPI002601C5A8|nr:DUF1707 domain-containing protein [Ferrimicrobium sp.]